MPKSLLVNKAYLTVANTEIAVGKIAIDTYEAISAATAEHNAVLISRAIAKGDRVLADALATSFRDGLNATSRGAIAKSAFKAICQGPKSFARSVSDAVSDQVAPREKVSMRRNIREDIGEKGSRQGIRSSLAALNRRSVRDL